MRVLRFIRRFPGRSTVVLAVTLALVLSSMAGARHGAAAHPGVDSLIHPSLLGLMKSDPDARVPVIVQKSRPDASSQEIARGSGGEVAEEYAFIHSFSITVPARAISGLAHNPNVRYISPDGPMDVTAVDTANLQTTYPFTSQATSLWNTGTGLTGKGVTVAVIDSGVNPHADFQSRVLVRWSSRSSSLGDPNGHGTHVAGIIAGRSADGRYIGVAPDANILALKVADDKYMTSESSVIRALQWAYDNRAQYNIRVINMSLAAATPVPYIYSPLAAATEKLWQAGVVVVVSAGNRGWGANVMHYPPANDAFAITVGALDNNLTVDPLDDTLATFSSYGITQNNMSKPDLVAPGRKIVAPLAGSTVVLAKAFPDRITPDGKYIRLSGTSMAAPVVSGLVALMLERYPTLTPDEVKWALMETRRTYAGQPAGSNGQIDITAALSLINSYRSLGMPLGRANQGYLWNPQSNLLSNNLSWDTTNWSAVTYDGVYTDASYWEATYWEATYWEATYWEATYWEATYWEATASEVSSSFD